MKAFLSKLLLALPALIALNVPATTRYVDVNSPGALSPFLDWSTAATNIQDAVDIALAGDEIVVTNGLYATGGRAVIGTMTNRVAVDKLLTLRSVNGPAYTFIQGYKVPGTTNGDGAIRCVWLTNGASLFGFTLTNGATRTNGDSARERGDGGLLCGSLSSIVSNCVMVGNSASYGGGGAMYARLYNCILSGNSAVTQAGYGGGAYGSTLNDCTLSNNVASLGGGGAWGGFLTNCTLTGNSASSGQLPLTRLGSGGGADACPILFNCVLSGNSADNGGGGMAGELGNEKAYNCVLSNNVAWLGGGTWGVPLVNCTVTGNQGQYGGGANCSGPLGGTLTNCKIIGNRAERGGGVVAGVSGSLNNCLIVGNVATNYGGGVGDQACCYTGFVLNNCTIYGNSAPLGGGVYLANSVADINLTLNNCIVVSNTATSGANYFRGTFNYCCTTPSPTNGVGSFTNAPLFVDSTGGNFRLQTNSPCINAGNNLYATFSPDLDGNPRIAGGTVDLGAYELPSPASTLSYAWAQQYGLPTDGTVDTADPDGDGANNWQESHAATNPTNTLSVLRLVNATNGPTGATVTWQSVATRNYRLERATNLGAASPFQLISNNIAGAAGTKTVTDATATNAGPYFYRVGVQ